MGLLTLPSDLLREEDMVNDIVCEKARLKLNPRTVVEWLNLDTDRPGVQILHYVFWAFRPCIEGLRCCRNVISVDGTYLYTKYKHKLLVAVTLDANQQVLPLAFALVDEESLASWRCFLEMLAKHLLPYDDDRVCLISDRHGCLISSINYVPAFKFPCGVHRFCLRHMCSNFNKKFNNIWLKDLCWRAGAEVNARKFERIMTEIRELNEEAYNWLGMIEKTQWTLSHDGGWRTSILTTNMSECVSRHFGVNASNFIPQYYSMRTYRKTYHGRFEPLYGEEYWDPIDFELVHNSAIRAR
ncbi:hypothetical protein Sango_0248900 [Sesamum angolense]|uniref:MULE transposase domain-containing protein n=1 Tax=Sesamum angolense TaxID=2727404 RepID=A0AAE1XHB7_9LAMI|nr:hypothetical protein Sango_0248900 [Sesamum angolense]